MFKKTVLFILLTTSLLGENNIKGNLLNRILEVHYDNLLSQPIHISLYKDKKNNFLKVHNLNHFENRLSFSKEKSISLGTFNNLVSTFKKLKLTEKDSSSNTNFSIKLIKDIFYKVSLKKRPSYNEEVNNEAFDFLYLCLKTLSLENEFKKIPNFYTSPEEDFWLIYCSRILENEKQEVLRYNMTAKSQKIRIVLYPSIKGRISILNVMKTEKQINYNVKIYNRDNSPINVTNKLSEQEYLLFWNNLQKIPLDTLSKETVILTDGFKVSIEILDGNNYYYTIINTPTYLAEKRGMTSLIDFYHNYFKTFLGDLLPPQFRYFIP